MKSHRLIAGLLALASLFATACSSADAAPTTEPVAPATRSATPSASTPQAQATVSTQGKPGPATDLARPPLGENEPLRTGNGRPPRQDIEQFASSVSRDVTYCTADGVDLKMDIYYPKTAPAGVGTAVIYVHGGGWTAGDKTAGEGIADMPELLRRGYTIFAVNYRLVPEYLFPAALEDVKCAVRSIRANAATYNIDPDHIGAWGGSAGVHLVNMLGTTDAGDGFEGDGGYAGVSSRVQAVGDHFGPADFTVSFTGGSATTLLNVFGIEGGNASPEAALVSPVTYATSDDPPFAIFQGEEDILVDPDQSVRMYNALIAVGVEATLTMVENAGHGFVASGGPISPSRNDIAEALADFFDAHLR